MNPQPGYGNPDAYLTGEMQKGLFVDVRDDVAVFGSTSPHATFMIKRDGDWIFGLTQDSKDKVRPDIMEQACIILKDKTGTI